MLYPELPGQRLSERLHTVALRGMVTSAKVVDATFPRRVGRRLRGFTTNIGINASLYRQRKVTLSRPGAPGDAPYHFRTGTYMERPSFQPLFKVPGKYLCRHSLRQLPLPQKPRKRPRVSNTKHIRQLPVVPVVRMIVQGEVVGDQVDIVVKQGLDTGFFSYR